MTDHPVYMYAYFMCAYLITHYLVPFTCIAVLNTHAAMRIYHMRTARRQLTRQERGEQRTTLMMFVVLVSFALCNTLPLVMNLFETTHPQLFFNRQTVLAAYIMNDVRCVRMFAI
jgi:hypothetical protein